MRRLILLLFIHIYAIFPADAQHDEMIYEAFISSDMDRWKQIADSMEAYPDKTDEFRFALLNYWYGYIGWCIGTGKTDVAEHYLEKAWVHTDYFEQIDYKTDYICAYKAAFVGYEMGISLYKAPFFIFDCIDYADRAYEKDSTNYFAVLQRGNIEFYLPWLLGGSKESAIEYYLKAKELYERDKELSLHDWKYLNLLVTIIRAYKETGEYAKAEEYCLEVLKQESEFDWVKNYLYPEIKEILRNEYY